MENVGTQTDPLAKDKLRFAYDVVGAVVQCCNGFLPPIPPGEQTHENFLFTDEHKDDVFDFLQQNKNKLKKIVNESKKENTAWNYNDDNYIHCKRTILQEFKPVHYSEKEFVRLCAGIAYIAIGNRPVSHNNDVLVEAVNELNSWMARALLPGGTLQNSTWAEN